MNRKMARLQVEALAGGAEADWVKAITTDTTSGNNQGVQQAGPTGSSGTESQWILPPS